MGTQGALEKVAGVESAKVSFPDKQAVVVCADAVDEGALRAAVESAGFKVVG